MKKLITLLTTFLITFLSWTPLAYAADQPFTGEIVSVGVVGDLGKEIWDYVAEKAAQEESIQIKVELLTDYNQPNEAVNNGSLDLNAFQHVAFLDDWNASNKATLTNIGYTFVTEMGIFSDSLVGLEELEDGASVAIPNDPTNGGRALLALELAGLIEVADEAGILATVDDITANPKHLDFIEIDAHQVALSLPDVDLGVLGTGLATDAGLAIDDALFVDTEDLSKLDQAYRNVIVSREEDAENPLFLKVVELFQQEDVAKVINQASNGGAIPAWKE